jgi:hypothetical protein
MVFFVWKDNYFIKSDPSITTIIKASEPNRLVWSVSFLKNIKNQVEPIESLLVQTLKLCLVTVFKK